MSDTRQLNRWRLILGSYASRQLSFSNGASLEDGISCMDLEEVLDFLYSREQGEDVRRDGRPGGTGASHLTAATWITRIRKLFPKETVEILERHALDNYGMTDLLTDKEVLEKLEPNQELLKTILQLKHLMKGEVLDAARRIVKRWRRKSRRSCSRISGDLCLGKWTGTAAVRFRPFVTWTSKRRSAGI